MNETVMINAYIVISIIIAATDILLGGEPMQQIMDDSLLNLLKRIKQQVDFWGLPVWVRLL